MLVGGIPLHKPLTPAPPPNTHTRRTHTQVLLFLAVTSVLIVLLMNAVEPALAAQLQGRAVLGGGFMAWARSVMIGGSASLVIAAPQAVMESRTPQETQPPSQRRYYICLLAMCLCGNLLEEVGYSGPLHNIAVATQCTT